MVMRLGAALLEPYSPPREDKLCSRFARTAF